MRSKRSGRPRGSAPERAGRVPTASRRASVFTLRPPRPPCRCGARTASLTSRGALWRSSARESFQARYGAPGRPPGPPPAAAARLDGPTCAAIRAELVEAGRDEGFLAALAVDLADIIDYSIGTLGFPVIIRELRITMDAALSGAKAAADPLDDLRRRRDRKLRGGL